jgi:hypothetical protein
MPLHAHQSADVCTVCITTSARLQRVLNTLPRLSSHNTFCTMGVKQLICCLGTAPFPAPVPSPSPSPPPSLTPAPNPRAPNIRFRVLIIGRANAGKTSILQRVCDTTESPVIYRSGPSGTQSQVCAHSQWYFQSHHRPSRLNSNPQ